MLSTSRQSIAIIVAHPNDETLWSGGTLLANPGWDSFICCLSHGKDPDQGPRFLKALKRLNAQGAMGNLDDGASEAPLPASAIAESILSLLPQRTFDILFTHSPEGEYTSHLRHEEIGKAVIGLWASRLISTDELRVFAYEDGNRQYRPRAITVNTRQIQLHKCIWKEKLAIITDVYGHSRSSWEAQATTPIEAFHCFDTPEEAAGFFGIETCSLGSSSGP